MNRRLCGLVFILVLCGFFLSNPDSKERGGKPPQPANYPVLEFWQHVIWGMEWKKEDLTRLPEAVQPHVAAYLKRREAFRSRLAVPPWAVPGSPEYQWPAHMYFDQQVRMERVICALIPDPQVPAAAAAFVLLNPGCYEWEGQSHCPLQEIRFAESFLKAYPDTALQPFLFVFLMHRFRAVAECEDVAGDTEAVRRYLDQSNTYHRRARETGDPLICFIVDSMGKARSVYREDRPQDLKGPKQ